MVKFLCLAALTVCFVAGGEDITPRVGVVEVYGAHKISAEKVMSAIGVKPGGPLPSRLDAEEKIGKLTGVVGSRVEAICCSGQQTILYIGVEERNAAHIVLHSSPTGDIKLPKEIDDTYQKLLDATAASMHAHNADEDLTNGYSLMADPEARDLQRALIPLVEANLAHVDQVLREAADPDERAAAAYVMQYGPRSVRAGKTIADALQFALQDPDESVRKNAVISLNAVMVGARSHPEQQIHIQATWFVELMNSVVWSDRHNASLALLTLTDKGNRDALSLIRERALDSVVEMARWHDLKHALPGFILAGRLAGLNENEIQAAWVSGDREPVLDKVENPNGKRSGINAILHHDPKKSD